MLPRRLHTPVTLSDRLRRIRRALRCVAHRRTADARITCRAGGEGSRRGAEVGPVHALGDRRRGSRDGPAVRDRGPGQLSIPRQCCLCRRHHRLKTHAPGWLFTMTDDGVLTVTTPAGVTRVTRPPRLGDRALLVTVPGGDLEEDPPPF